MTTGQKQSKLSYHIAFATEKDLIRLAATETIYMDGNFKMAPPQFTQVLCAQSFIKWY